MTKTAETTMPHVHLRCMAEAWTTDELGERVRAYPSEWMKVIHTANRIARDDNQTKPFGAPTFLGPWWAGGSVEEYDDARVIHRGDGTVSITSKTDRGAGLLVAAADELHIFYHRNDASRRAGRVGTYVQSPNGTTHIVNGPVFAHARTMCGRPFGTGWDDGDETASGHLATCRMCKSLFRK